MDEIDIAQEQAALFLSSALAAAAKARPGPAPTGQCLNCDAELGSVTRRFCDRDCRDDWEHRDSRGRAAGNGSSE